MTENVWDHASSDSSRCTGSATWVHWPVKISEALGVHSRFCLRKLSNSSAADTSRRCAMFRSLSTCR